MSEQATQAQAPESVAADTPTLPPKKVFRPGQEPKIVENKPHKEKQSRYEAMAKALKAEKEPTPPEAPSAAAPEPPPSPEPAAPTPDLLAQQQALIDAEQKLRAEREQLAALQAELAEAKAFKTAFEEDKYKALESQGVDLDAWARQKLGLDPAQPDPVESIRAELEEIRKWKEEQSAQAQASKIQAEYETVRNSSLDNIGKMLENASTDQWAYVKALGGAEMVFEVIENAFQPGSGVPPLSPEEAANQAEEYLKAEAARYAPLLSPSAEPAQPSVKPVTPQAPPQEPAPPIRRETARSTRADRRKAFASQLRDK